MTWVHDMIYAAGGDHIPATWAQFSDQTGITAVFHLDFPRPARFVGPPPEKFLWLNVVDEPQADLDERFLAARFLHTCLQAERRVLLHSSFGRHRTRWAYVAYWIFAGRSVRTALRMASKRPWLSPYHTSEDGWVAFAQACMTERST